MAKRDDSTWIALHDKFPESPKIASLSDSGFRCFIEALAYCHRNLTDGVIAKGYWPKIGTTAKGRADVIRAGLITERDDGDRLVRDYLDWQMSAEDVRAARARKSTAGKAGNHERWHVQRGESDPTCTDCRSQMRSVCDRITDRITVADIDTDTEIPVVDVVMSSAQPERGVA